MPTLARMVYLVGFGRFCNGVACVIGGLFGQVCLLMTLWGLYGAMVPQVPLIVNGLGLTLCLDVIVGFGSQNRCYWCFWG